MVAPLLGKGGNPFYNWAFVIGIIAASCWVIVTWVQKCGPQLADTGSREKERDRAA